MLRSAPHSHGYLPTYLPVRRTKTGSEATPTAMRFTLNKGPGTMSHFSCAKGYKRGENIKHLDGTVGYTRVLCAII